MSKYLDLELKEINKLLKEKKITPTTLVEECFERIEANKDLNAFITLDKENGLFSGEVSIAEHTGNNVIVHMNVNGNEVVALEEERNRREVDYAPDSILNFSFSLSDVYLFDAESGRNILYGVDNE